LAGKPENFDKMSDRFKLTLLQMEKRFVDLETAISETREKLKDVNIDLLTSLQQRVDDIEDLIMVEQAGILEIKKMMEAEQQKRKDTADVAAVARVEDRLDKIDQAVKSLSAEQPGLEVEERLKKLQGDVASLSVRAVPDLGEIHEKIAEKEQQLNSLKGAIDDQMVTFERRVRDIMTKSPEKMGIDFDFVSSKIDSLKTGLDIMTDRKVETDLKIAGLEEKIALLDNKIRESLSQKFLDEIKINKRDIMTTNVRVESVEKVLREITGETHELGKTVKKFENFERLTLLNKEVEEKLQRFKFIEDETSRLSSRMELMYNDLDKRLETVRSIEKGFGKVSDAVSNLMKEVDRNKFETSQRLKKEDVQNMVKGLEQQNREIEKMFGEFENRMRMITKSQVGQLKSDMERMKAVVGGLDKMKDVKPADVGRWLGEANALNTRVEELSHRLGNLEGRIASMQSSVSEARQPNLDMQLGEMVNKLVFLETRLGAMENVMSRTQSETKVQPIILE